MVLLRSDKPVFGIVVEAQLHDGGSTRQAFGDALHQRELLGPGDQLAARFGAVSIDVGFDVAQQGRGILNLVDDEGRCMFDQERFARQLGRFGHGGDVERHVAVPQKSPGKQAGLARLAAACQYYGRPLGCQLSKNLFYFPLNPQSLGISQFNC